GAGVGRGRGDGGRAGGGGRARGRDPARARGTPRHPVRVLRWRGDAAALLPGRRRVLAADRRLRLTEHLRAAGRAGRGRLCGAPPAPPAHPARGPALEPVHGGGAEVGEAVLRPQAAVPRQTLAVGGPGRGPPTPPG